MPVRLAFDNALTDDTHQMRASEQWTGSHHASLLGHKPRYPHKCIYVRFNTRVASCGIANGSSAQYRP